MDRSHGLGYEAVYDFLDAITDRRIFDLHRPIADCRPNVDESDELDPVFCFLGVEIYSQMSWALEPRSRSTALVSACNSPPTAIIFCSISTAALTITSKVSRAMSFSSVLDILSRAE